jgi:hypothetical protein
MVFFGFAGRFCASGKVDTEEVDAVNFQNVLRAADHREPKKLFGGRDIYKDLTPTSEYKIFQYKKQN